MLVCVAKKGVAVLVDVPEQLAVVGISHIAQPKAWAEFFVRLREMGPVGSFINGFLPLTIGTLIVSFHNVWTGIPAVLTLLGWAYVVKSLICLVLPSVGLKNMARVSVERSGSFVVAGVGLVALSGLLFYARFG